MTEKPPGFLNVNKPAGITSRRGVDVVRRVSGQRRCGHAGTLDPLATGVLLVALGSATRLVEYAQRLPKTYRARFQLGATSPTDDVTGELKLVPGARAPTRDELLRAIAAQVGRVQQRPPQFSALKVAGRRAHQLARKGQHVELAEREVEIYSIELLDYSYPMFEVRVRCGGGTYVRAIGRDVAESCGTKGVMSELIREAIGSFTVDDSVELARIEAEGVEAFLQSSERVLEGMPKLVLEDWQIERVRNGGLLDLELPGASEAVVFGSRGELCAIVARRPDGRWGPKKNLA